MHKLATCNKDAHGKLGTDLCVPGKHVTTSEKDIAQERKGDLNELKIDQQVAVKEKMGQGWGAQNTQWKRNVNEYYNNNKKENLTQRD